MSVTCPTHGPVAGTYSVQAVGSTERIRVECGTCGRYIKWAALTPENWKRAGRPARASWASSKRSWTDGTRVNEELLRSKLMMELRQARVPDDVIELVDLLLLVGWERALRVTVTCAIAQAAEHDCPPAYQNLLRAEANTWAESGVEPITRELRAPPVQGRLL